MKRIWSGSVVEYSFVIIHKINDRVIERLDNYGNYDSKDICVLKAAEELLRLKETPMIPGEVFYATIEDRLLG